MSNPLNVEHVIWRLGIKDSLSSLAKMASIARIWDAIDKADLVLDPVAIPIPLIRFVRWVVLKSGALVVNAVLGFLDDREGLNSPAIATEEILGGTRVACVRRRAGVERSWRGPASLACSR